MTNNEGGTPPIKFMYSTLQAIDSLPVDSINRRLGEFMVETGKSVEEVAKALDLSKPAVYALLKSSIKPRRKTLQKITQYINQ